MKKILFLVLAVMVLLGCGDGGGSGIDSIPVVYINEYRGVTTETGVIRWTVTSSDVIQRTGVCWGRNVPEVVDPFTPVPPGGEYSCKVSNATGTGEFTETISGVQNLGSGTTTNYYAKCFALSVNGAMNWSRTTMIIRRWGS